MRSFVQNVDTPKDLFVDICQKSGGVDFLKYMCYHIRTNKR